MAVSRKNRCKLARDSVQLSQEGFARLLKVRKTTVVRWETGKQRLKGTAQALMKLIAADPALAKRVLDPSGDIPRHRNITRFEPPSDD